MMSLKGFILKRLKQEAWERFNWEVDKKQDIQRACFVVFDTETTGLDLKKDEALSIGAVKIENLRIDLSKSFYALLKPTRELTQSVKVHGITPQELKEARDRREVCLDFIEYARGCILVGYFVHIDVTMIKKLVERECEGFFHPHTLDIVDMLEKKDRIPTLEELLKTYGLPVSSFHNAIEDAYMTALVFLRLLKEERYSKVGELPLRH